MCVNALTRLLFRRRLAIVTYMRLAFGSFDNYRVALVIRVVAVAGKRRVQPVALYVRCYTNEREGGEGRFLTFLAASSESNLVPPSLIEFVDPPSKKRNSFSAQVPPFRRLAL